VTASKCILKSEDIAAVTNADFEWAFKFSKERWYIDGRGGDNMCNEIALTSNNIKNCIFTQEEKMNKLIYQLKEYLKLESEQVQFTKYMLEAEERAKSRVLKGIRARAAVFSGTSITSDHIINEDSQMMSAAIDELPANRGSRSRPKRKTVPNDVDANDVVPPVVPTNKRMRRLVKFKG